jgi:flagellin
MGQVINTNSLSLLTQNNLNKSQASLNTAIQRLSSGMRINSAKDDAAGQAIANRFTSNIKGLTQASRNANDGISMAQTTEGALGEINTNLQRIRELAVQSLNATNSGADKTSIQAEINQRLAEITRTSEQTDFNGTKVLNKDQSLKIQVGANDNEVINIDLKKMDLAALSLSSFNVDGLGSVANAAASGADLTGFVKSVTAETNGAYKYTNTVTTTNLQATSVDVFSKLQNNDTVTSTSTATGLNTTATASTYTYNAASNSFSFSAMAVAMADADSYLTPASGGTTAAKVTIGTSASQDVLIANSGKLTAADDGAALYLDSSGNLTKNNAGGLTQTTLSALTTNMTATVAAGAGTGGSIISGGTTLTANVGANTFDVVNAKISSAKLTTDANVTGYTTSTGYTVATGGAAGSVTKTAGGASVYVDAASSALTVVASTDKLTERYEQLSGVVTDNTGAQLYKTAAGALTFDKSTASAATSNPLDVLDKALSTVDKLRGALGAVQNRFDSVISNLGTTLTNLSASRSRIEDADYATEVSNMTRANILQQAGTSVLAQANQTSQGVLSLLR